MTAIRIIDSHLELADVGANNHHNELHTIASHSDTSATGAQLDILTDNSIADTLHRHSELVASDGSPDPALSVDAVGKVGIGRSATAGKLEVEFAAGGAPIFEMITSDTNVSRSGQILKHTTTGNMVDGLGISFLFRIEDVTSGVQTIAQIKATRDGADNEGRLDLQAGTGGGERFITIRSSGRVGINNQNPATSALMDLTSTTGALLLTRMTTAQKNALTAVNGMVLYDSTLNKFQGYENGSWASLI